MQPIDTIANKTCIVNDKNKNVNDLLNMYFAAYVHYLWCLFCRISFLLLSGYSMLSLHFHRWNGDRNTYNYFGSTLITMNVALHLETRFECTENSM